MNECGDLVLTRKKSSWEIAYVIRLSNFVLKCRQKKTELLIGNLRTNFVVAYSIGIFFGYFANN